MHLTVKSLVEILDAILIFKASFCTIELVIDTVDDIFASILLGFLTYNLLVC